ncbi:MAG: hypothetical protein GXZ19_04935 [Bacteroidales bacterium]|nr:hypothetical protein [Bacteroidales bacterium]
MKNGLILFLYFSLTILIGPIRALGNIGVKLSSLVGFVLFYLLTIFLIRKYGRKISLRGVLWMGLLGISLPTLPFRIIHFQAALGTLLEYILHLSAVIAGYYYVRVENRNNKILFNSMCAIVVSIASFYIDDLILKLIFK